MNDSRRNSRALEKTAQVAFDARLVFIGIEGFRHDHPQGHPMHRQTAHGDDLYRSVPIEQSEGADDFQQSLRLQKEKFGLGEGIEDFHRFPVVMAPLRDSQCREGGLDAAAQRRHAGRQFIDTLLGKEAEEAVFPPNPCADRLPKPEIHQRIGAKNWTEAVHLFHHHIILPQQPLTPDRRESLQMTARLNVRLCRRERQAGAGAFHFSDRDLVDVPFQLQAAAGKRQEIAAAQPVTELAAAARGGGVLPFPQPPVESRLVVSDLEHRRQDTGQPLLQRCRVLGGCFQLDDDQRLPGALFFKAAQLDDFSLPAADTENGVGHNLKGQSLGDKQGLQGIEQEGGIGGRGKEKGTFPGPERQKADGRRAAPRLQQLEKSSQPFGQLRRRRRDQPGVRCMVQEQGGQGRVERKLLLAFGGGKLKHRCNLLIELTGDGAVTAFIDVNFHRSISHPGVGGNEGSCITP